MTVDNYQSKSPETDDYNCIAWVLGIEDERIWPDTPPRYSWPEGLPVGQGVESFVALFQREGYEPCDNADQEDGFEKIAIYVKDGAVTHAARQLESGEWTSKLGDWQDINHDTPEVVGGDAYGEVAAVVRKPREPEREQVPLIPVEEFEAVVRSVFNAPKEDVDEEISTMQAANRRRREERS